MNRWRRTLRTLQSHLLLACAIVAGSREASAARSADGVWIESTGDDLMWHARPYPQAALGSPPPSRRFALDDRRLVAILAGAPRESSTGARGEGVALSLPLPDGRYAEFRIEETQVLSERLRAELPDMRTYIGRSADGTTLDARLDRGPNGFHAMIRTFDDLVFVRPVAEGSYESYRMGSIEAPDGVRCEVADASGFPVTASMVIPPSGATLSTYDMAISVTGEYTSRFHGRAGALAQITTTINQLNAIYEPEVAIRFRLTCVAIPPTAAGDRYPGPDTLNATVLLDLNTVVLDDSCGAGGYDIGHLLHRRALGYAGVARFASVCTAGHGAGISGGVDPTSGLFVADLLSHEVGHQFNARHTFNTSSFPCAGARSGDDAYEIASGTTIMSYAFSGCGEDILGTAMPFFHTHSFDQITDLRDGAAACRATTGTGNHAPIVDAGPDLIIPRQTPFVLTATGSDPDGHPITYQWQEFDRGAPSPPLNGAVNGPIFRDFFPSTSPTRSFPDIFGLVVNSAPFEFLPAVNRTLHFRCTARDNRAGGGGVSYDEVAVTVQGDPFVVSSPNGGETLHADCLTPVTWTVGGGQAASVNILLSTDGITFPTVLAAGVPNDGSHVVRLPCVTTTHARIKVEAVDNVFFDISNATARIVNDAPVATVGATGGSVGPDCEILVPFSARITDDCRVETGAVQVTAASLDGRATVDAPAASMNVVAPGDVRVTGTVRVSALTACPALVRITVQGRDGCGRTATRTTDVQVHDATPPGISVALSDASLWPPNHELETITAGVVVTDCPGALFVLKSVTSDEPEDGAGDGGAEPDIAGAATGTPDLEFQLRAERSGASRGRVYSIVYEATDACGNRGEAVATVRVDHDRSESGAGRGHGPPAARTGARAAADASAALAPGRTGLVSIHPSPFFGGTTVTFDVERATTVTVNVHDLAGRRVRSIAAGGYGAGRYTLAWDGRDDAGDPLGAGIYFVRFVAGGEGEVRKAVLMRR